MRSMAIALIFFVALITVSFGWCGRKSVQQYPLYQIKNNADIQNLFNQSATSIAALKTTLLAQAHKAGNAFIAKQDRSYENTPHVLDHLGELSNLMIMTKVFHVLEMLSPEQSVRDAAHEAVLEIEKFWVDEVSLNKAVYEAFKEYAEGAALTEHLSDEQRYYVQETMADFKRAGLHLPSETLEQLKSLKKELSGLSMAFSKAIADVSSTIVATKEQLDGLDEDFINQLAKTPEGEYRLGVDYPTFTAVMQNCSVEDTRKRLFDIFLNRAYPENEETIKQIIAKRDAIAQLLGLDSFATLDLADQMVKTPENAYAFINELISASQEKELQELDRYKKELPESVHLVNGQFKPWDIAYLAAQYKKKHYNIDERQIMEYFPMQNTIDQLLDIYRQFFSIEFVQEPISGMWHEEVKLVNVYNQDRSRLLGRLLLDLHPRPNKYSHACQIGVIPAVKLSDDQHIPAVVIVVANFPKPTESKPALLPRSDVKTFFHEFGHALHSILGETQVASFAGTNVKRDFVEMPSQMLEEWLDDRDMLKKVTHHYKTGEPLSEQVIDTIIALKNFDAGNFIQTQCLYARMALDFFAPGADKQPYDIYKKLYTTYRPAIMFAPNTHMYTSFGHLTGYGAKYYGYLWSKVFALDLFDEIKKHGLLNPEIGKRYVDLVIGKGGSKDPNQLLEDFLGRKPNNHAFLRDMGLNK